MSPYHNLIASEASPPGDPVLRSSSEEPSALLRYIMGSKAHILSVASRNQGPLAETTSSRLRTFKRHTGNKPNNDLKILAYSYVLSESHELKEAVGITSKIRGYGSVCIS